MVWLGDLDEKALRRVRTPEGAKKYGQPIGTIITTDIASQYVGRPGEITRSGHKPKQGLVATTTVVHLPDGTPAISKVMVDENRIMLSARHQSDAEYLASLVGRAVAAKVPMVYQVEPEDNLDDLDLEDFDFDNPDAKLAGEGQTEVWMNLVPGKTAGDMGVLRVEDQYLVQEDEHDRTWYITDARGPRFNQNGSETGFYGRRYNERWQAERRKAELTQAERRRRTDEAASDDERLLGLLDLLIFNSDRNINNWMVTEDGDIVGIDHGGAFADRRSGDSLGVASAGQIGGVLWPRALGWFSEHFYAPLGPDELTAATRKLNPSNDMSPHDMALIERALRGLRGEFNALGRADWYSEMMRRFELLKIRAKGTKDRLFDDEEKGGYVFWLEEKALRRVRTPEGARQYGQPIGTIIRRDVSGPVNDLVNAAPREAGRRARLATLGDEIDDASNPTYRTQLPDGTEAVVKVYKHAGPMAPDMFDSQRQVDAEVLGALVGHAIGAPVPNAVQGPDEYYADGSFRGHTVLTPWVNGAQDAYGLPPDHPRVAYDRYRTQFDATTRTYSIESDDHGTILTGLLSWEDADAKVREFTLHEWDRKAMGLDDDELLIGLLDLLIYNVDRHTGNWLVTNNDQVVGIDHGRAWQHVGDYSHQSIYAHRRQYSDGIDWPVTPYWFSLPFLGPILGGDDPAMNGQRYRAGTRPNPMSPHDMALIRRALEGIKPEFERLGRLEWWDDMMTRFNVLEANAQGTVNRLEE